MGFAAWRLLPLLPLLLPGILAAGGFGSIMLAGYPVLLGYALAGTAVLLLGTLLFIALSCTIVLTHSGLAARREHERGIRFLCPACLRFDRPRYPCPTCGRELDPAIVRTDGLYLDRCPRCAVSLLAKEDAAPAPTRLRVVPACRHCGHYASASCLHRRVGVLGTLSEVDLAALQRAAGVVSGVRPGRFCIEGEEALAYGLCLEDDETFVWMANEHAARDLDVLWLDTAARHPLELGEAVDRYVRRANLESPGRRRIAVRVRPEREAVEAPARRLLEARFGEITYGVPPEAALWECGVPAEALLARRECDARC